MHRGIVALGASLLSLTLVGCGRPAQIGADRDAFKAVDALYTAVSLRDPALLDRCEMSLKKLRDTAKLPEGAATSVEAVIAEARGGKWEPAQEHLATFMEGQCR